MKQQSTRDLFAYWNGRRNARPAPERADIEPGDIRRALADVFLLGHEPGHGAAFRLAGTRVCALFSRELRNVPFLDIWEETDRGEIERHLRTIEEEATGFLFAARGQTANRGPVDLEGLVLPLSHRGRLGRRAIGTLVASPQPDWLGLDHVVALSLGSFRFLASVTAAAPVMMRHGLTLYQGGRP